MYQSYRFLLELILPSFKDHKWSCEEDHTDREWLHSSKDNIKCYNGSDGSQIMATPYGQVKPLYDELEKLKEEIRTTASLSWWIWKACPFWWRRLNLIKFMPCEESQCLYCKKIYAFIIVYFKLVYTWNQSHMVLNWLFGLCKLKVNQIPFSRGSYNMKYTIEYHYVFGRCKIFLYHLWCHTTEPSFSVLFNLVISITLLGWMNLTVIVFFWDLWITGFQALIWFISPHFAHQFVGMVFFLADFFFSSFAGLVLLLVLVAVFLPILIALVLVLLVVVVDAVVVSVSAVVVALDSTAVDISQQTHGFSMTCCNANHFLRSSHNKFYNKWTASKLKSISS